MPPLVEIPGGVYPIGDDEPITWAIPGESGTTTSHVPRHSVEVATFWIGRFPVTNAEWACFVAAGGYDDERWWDTDDGRRWRRGELANEAAKDNNRQWRQRFQDDAGMFSRMADEGRIPGEGAVERWRHWLTLDDPAFEEALSAHWTPRRQTEPVFWHDARVNGSTQPVVGISWYEARAYGNWMTAQSTLRFRLPQEVEWEAAARGRTGRRHAWGDSFDPLKGNAYETQIRQTTPVGVFVEGDTHEGVSDLCGNVSEWTSSLWGVDEQEPEFRYPYDPTDGRENPEAASNAYRIARGGSWADPQSFARTMSRPREVPVNRSLGVGARMVASVLVSH